MRKRFALVVAVMLLCSSAVLVADILLVIPPAGSGRKPYLYDTITRTPSEIRFDNALYETGQPQPPTPTPGPQPPAPTPGDPVAAAVEAAARKANQPEVAIGLSKAYLTVVDFLKQGKLTAAQAAGAIKKATELTRSQLSANAEWDNVVKAIEAQAITALQAGKLETPADWIAFGNSVAVGLDAAGGNAALSDFFKQLLQALLQAIIKAILETIGGGGTTGGGIDLG